MSDHWQLLHIDWHKGKDILSLSALILWVRFTCPHPWGATEVQGIQLTYWIIRFDGAEGRRVWEKQGRHRQERIEESRGHRKWKRGVTRKKQSGNVECCCYTRFQFSLIPAWVYPDWFSLLLSCVCYCGFCIKPQHSGDLENEIVCKQLSSR